MTWMYSPINMGTTTDPCMQYPLAQGYPLGLEPLWALPLRPLKPLRRLLSPLTIFVYHRAEALLDSHHTQHFFVSHLMSYEALWLTAPHITLLCCNNLNPAPLLPSVSDEVSHNCLMLTYHRLTPPDNLQKILLGDMYFSLFTDGSLSMGSQRVRHDWATSLHFNGKYCAGFATSTSFGSFETEPLLMATSAQHAELYSLRVACTLAEGKLLIFILTGETWFQSTSRFWNVVKAEWLPYFQHK